MVESDLARLIPVLLGPLAVSADRKGEEVCNGCDIHGWGRFFKVRADGYHYLWNGVIGIDKLVERAYIPARGSSPPPRSGVSGALARTAASAIRAPVLRAFVACALVVAVSPAF
jgi:hypothetical protein